MKIACIYEIKTTLNSLSLINVKHICTGPYHVKLCGLVDVGNRQALNGQIYIIFGRDNMYVYVHAVIYFCVFINIVNTNPKQTYHSCLLHTS